jgi:NAD(P)-dependent dehydrogenase (short-subunit alcohol dehydrogenase family)
MGGLDVLFNNAGTAGAVARIDEIGAEEWDRTQALLLRSVALGIRHASTHMKAGGGGAIVNTSSIAGLFAGYSPIAYAVAKAGVIQLSRVAAAELAQYSIRVNSICPGFITSNIFATAAGLSGEKAAQVNAAIKAASPAASCQRGFARGNRESLPVFGERRICICHRRTHCGGWRPDSRSASFLGSCDYGPDSIARRERIEGLRSFQSQAG